MARLTLLLLQLGVVTVTGLEARDVVAVRPAEREEGHHPAGHPATAGGQADDPREEPHIGKVEAVQGADHSLLEVQTVATGGEVEADLGADQPPEVCLLYTSPSPRD